MKCSLIFFGLLISTSPAFATGNKISQAQFMTLELHDAAPGTERKIQIQDVDSKKVAQVTLQPNPTQPGVYDGFFVIQFLRGDNSARVFEFSEPGKAPYFSYASQIPGQQKIALFRSTEAMTQFIEKDAMVANQLLQAKKGPEVKTLAEKTKKLEVDVRKQNRMQEQTQLSLEEIQAKKRLDQLEQQAKLSAVERQRKIQLAQVAVEKADKFYAAQKYVEAEASYAEATVLNPEAESYLYRYGVSLYKNEKYNLSLATLSMSEAPDGRENEKSYYIALNHLKLKDYDKALKEMKEIRDENEPSISPTASYLAATIEIQQKKFPGARKSLEYVLDNSQDPSLDRNAEEMLEQVDQLERFYESKNEKYRFTLFGGTIYDGNVLNIAANNSATDVKAYRLTYGATALGVWYRTPNSDLGTLLSVSDYYSTNTQFKGDAALQTADAFEGSLSVPYHLDFAVHQKTYNLELSPYYKSTYLSPTGGTRSEAIRTTGATLNLATPLRSDLLISGKLDASSDTSYLPTTSADDDLSAKKYGLTLIPTWLLDLKGEKSLSVDVSYLVDQAEGKNYRYNQMGAGLTYGFPGWWRSNASARLDYVAQDYKDAATPRKDNAVSLTGSLVKDLSKTWNMLLSAQYVNANSPVDIYKYDKFVVSALFTWKMSILGKQ